MELIDHCLTRIHQVTGDQNTFTPLHEPSIGELEKRKVLDCLDSGWVSSVGKYVDQFEQDIREFTNIPHVSAVMNGTAALHICLYAAGVTNNDEVLVPAITFVATANAVRYCSAIPHLIDCADNQLNLDIAKLGEYLAENTIVKQKACYNKYTGRRIKAIIPVHVLGHMVDMEPLLALAEEYHFIVIEDAAEALGSSYQSKHAGSFGLVSALSFNGNKIITTGGGGAVLTKDPNLGKRIKHITTTAKKPHAWEFIHDELGFNYRLPNINAALGCAQLQQLNVFLENKRALHSAYLNAFKDVDAVDILQAEYGVSNHWLNALVFDRNENDQRDTLIEAASSQYGLRGLWRPLDLLPMYQDVPKMDLTHAHDMYKRVVLLPSSPNLRQ